MERFVVLNKKVGETPLMCAESYRATRPELARVPLAYAGRLDPMASGSLLILIGDECKVQEQYHQLDKQYNFSVLLDVTSDSGDILGIVNQVKHPMTHAVDWQKITRDFVGSITLPYPHYSSRTVRGKALHTWAIEGKLDEITIPTKRSTIYDLAYKGSTTYTRQDLYESVIAKIALLPPVTDPRKALGNDFRRPDVLKSWQVLRETGVESDIFSVAKFTCVASSGTYMRTLANEIAKKVDTRGLAFAIERTHLGKYQPLFKSLGFWKKQYR